jgi:hypothetical protein
MRRPWRGATLHDSIERAPGTDGATQGETQGVEVDVDGERLDGGVLREAPAPGSELRVSVRYG